MSLRPHPLAPIPEETARIACAAFPKGNPYLTLRDHVGLIFSDHDFADLYAHDGQPGLAPWRLALVTLLQFRENVADRQAAEAVRARIDWKYLLGLALTDSGFDFSVLSEFRDRLVKGDAAERLLAPLLTRCRALGLLKARGQQGLDQGIGHSMLFEADSAARAPVPPILVSRQTSSAVSDRKSAPQLLSRPAG